MTAVDDLLMQEGGAASRELLLTAISRATLDDQVRRGELVAVFPRAYAHPWDVDLRDVQLRAALASVGGENALSHITALERHQLPAPVDEPIHVTAYNPRHPRSVPGRLVVHRTLLPLSAVIRDDMPLINLENALISSWPLMSGALQRAPLIQACQRRLVDARRILDLAERMWWTKGIVSCRELVRLIAAGCHSELELFGYTDVFNVPGLDDADRQRKIEFEGKTYWLDVAYEDEMVDVELDGREFHSSDEQRERDEKRDIALAKLGWQTLRFSHARLRGDAEGCRRDVRAVRTVRRRRAS